MFSQKKEWATLTKRAFLTKVLPLNSRTHSREEQVPPLSLAFFILLCRNLKQLEACFSNKKFGRQVAHQQVLLAKNFYNYICGGYFSTNRTHNQMAECH